MDEEMGKGQDPADVLQGESMGEPVAREMSLEDALAVLADGE